MEQNFTEQELAERIKGGYQQAEEVLREDKFEKLISKLEEKLKLIPKIGEQLSHLPIMIAMVRSYIKKEYTEIPLGTILAVISTIIYFVNPIDLIPDTIPVIGHADDVALFTVCLALIDSDVKDYKKWRDEANEKAQ